jgi:enoyl-CoA hydratase/carnithine racemase
MTTYETIIVERPEPRIARIVMNRPEARNAQNLQMTYDLNAAFDSAVQDDAIKVIVLAGSGPHFSAGHDLRPTGKNAAGVDFPPIGNWGGFAEPNAHGRFAREQEIYLQITRRWRNLAKPTIAEVHGKCIAGGLMLAWACDLIVASNDAEFCDPVVTMGVCGVEWFVHPWELGARKAKEFLFTADVWSAAEAHRLGMVNHVVPKAELPSFVLALAQKIAAKPSFALKLTKEAVNRSVDVMGQPAAIDQAFALHQLCHAHNLQEFGMVVDPAGLHPSVRKPAQVKSSKIVERSNCDSRCHVADRPRISQRPRLHHLRRLVRDPARHRRQDGAGAVAHRHSGLRRFFYLSFRGARSANPESRGSGLALARAPERQVLRPR